MSSDHIADYLIKEVSLNRNVVTFRSLSREFSIHVNTAKNELGRFHAQALNSPNRVFATYLLSGDVDDALVFDESEPTQSDDSMDIDMDSDDEREEVERDIETTRFVLVGERDLKENKKQFRRIYGCHVYCLSASPLHDAGLICTPTDAVRQTDTKKGPEFAAVVGKVVSPDVKLKPRPVKSKETAPAAVASSSKPAAPPAVTKAKIEDKAKKSASPSVPPQPVREKTQLKKSGTLDWSNAKTKVTKQAATDEADKEKSKASSASTGKASKDEKLGEGSGRKAPSKNLEEIKRGTKRKSDVAAAGDVESPATSIPPSPQVKSETLPSSKPPSAKGPRIKRGAVVSDDEDDEQEVNKGTGKSKGKAKAVEIETEEERSLRAMMDIDDDQVIRVSRTNVAPPPRPISRASDVEEEQSAEDAMDEDPPKVEHDDNAMDEDSDPAMPVKKPKKKKEKKIVPVGRNGLKKKRVMKSRSMLDAKGYMVTEDYSSYESVDDGEADAQTTDAEKTTSKAKAKETSRKSTSGKTEKADTEKPEKKKPANEGNTAAGTKGTGERKPAVKAGGGVKGRPSGSGNLMNYFGGGGKGKK